MPAWAHNAGPGQHPRCAWASAAFGGAPVVVGLGVPRPVLRQGSRRISPSRGSRRISPSHGSHRISPSRGSHRISPSRGSHRTASVRVVAAAASVRVVAAAASVRVVRQGSRRVGPATGHQVIVASSAHR